MAGSGAGEGERMLRALETERREADGVWSAAAGPTAAL